MSVSSTLIPLAPFILAAFMALLAVLLIIGLTAVRFIFGGKKGKPQLDADEARLMQDLHHSFQKLEERVESLETIMLEAGSMRRANPAANPQRQPE